MEPKFDFYEQIIVSTTDAEAADIDGELGVVFARGKDEQGWGYTVYIYRDETCWDLLEHELVTTGQFDTQFHHGPSVRVNVKGEILD